MLLSILLALCLSAPPVPGPVMSPFQPGERYEGHWGLDLAAPFGSEVVAPADGVVTFSGEVAGMKSITILVSSDTRVSLSYLSSIAVGAGTAVSVGDVVGQAGRPHGEEGIHVSTRVGTRYVDPAGFFECRDGTIRLLGDR
jgi:murein DD-endopeptidase MepM/ murein hydrolase activator NlpD